MASAISIGTGNRINYVSARDEGGREADAHGQWIGGDEELRIVRGPDGKVAIISKRDYVLSAELDGTLNFRRKFEPPAFPEDWVPRGREGFTPGKGPDGSEYLVTDHGTVVACRNGGGSELYHHDPPNGIGIDEMLYATRSFFAHAGTGGGLNRQQLTRNPKGGILVGGVPRLVTSKHDGSALSQWFYDREECMRRMRITRDAGFLLVRTWWDLDGRYWEGHPDQGHWPGDRDRTIYPDKYGEQEYVRGCVEFLQFLESLGMAAHMARGTWTSTRWERMADIVAEIIRQAGAHTIGIGEALNEHLAVSPHTPIEDVTAFRERAYGSVGIVLRGNSGLGGFDIESKVINREQLLRYNPGASIVPFHGCRFYQWANKLERDWNVRYEWGMDTCVDGEGVGTGPYVSAAENLHQLNRAFFMVRHALMHACGYVPTKMDGAGVIPDGPASEEWGTQPAFDGVCKVEGMMPANAGEFSRKVFHGGKRWADERIYEAIGDTRVEHHVNPDTGEAIIVAYGDQSALIPKVRQFDVKADSWIEEGHIKGRVLYGQQ